MKSPKRTEPEKLVEPSPSAPPLREAIASLAYSYWEVDGRPEGGDMRYWLRAEREVLAQRGLPSPEEEGGA